MDNNNTNAEGLQLLEGTTPGTRKCALYFLLLEHVAWQFCISKQDMRPGSSSRNASIVLKLLKSVLGF